MRAAEVPTTYHGLMALDYDGTAAIENGLVPESVYMGAKSLWGAGIATTAITARPYQRLLTVSGGVQNIRQLIAPGVPLAAERGGRIVDLGKQANMAFTPLNAYELDAIVDAEYSDALDFVGFYSQEIDGPSYIWSPAEGKTGALIQRFSHDAMILPAGKCALRGALGDARPCLVTLRFNSPIDDGSLRLDQALNAAYERRTVAIAPATQNKRVALDALCDLAGIPLEQVRFAGNDHADLPILQCPGLRERIFVGHNTVHGMAEPVRRISSPQALGDYMIQVANQEKII